MQRDHRPGLPPAAHSRQGLRVAGFQRIQGQRRMRLPGLPLPPAYIPHHLHTETQEEKDGTLKDFLIWVSQDSSWRDTECLRLLLMLAPHPQPAQVNSKHSLLSVLKKLAFYKGG